MSVLRQNSEQETGNQARSKQSPVPFSFAHLNPQATAVMPTRECEVMTGMSLSRPIIRGFSSSANCHEFLPRNYMMMMMLSK